MDTALTLDHFRARYASAQAEAREARAAAFVRYEPVLAGQVLAPITLERYNLLVAFGSPFVVGGPQTVEDLLVFLWCLHPGFSQHDAAARRACYRAALRALQPRWPVLNAIARTVAPFSPRLRRLLRPFLGPTAAELEIAAVEEARRLVAEAIGEFPRGSDDGEPLPFAMQAQVLNLLRRTLAVPYAEARELPMKELAQLLREAVHHASEGKAPLLTPAEAAVWRDYLEWEESRLPAKN
jgi:hypothetical protein